MFKGALIATSPELVVFETCFEAPHPTNAKKANAEMQIGLIVFIENDRNQEKGEIVVLVGGATEVKDLAQDKLDELLQRLLQDLSVKAASQLVADLTGIKKKVAYQRALELTQSD